MDITFKNTTEEITFKNTTLIANAFKLKPLSITDICLIVMLVFGLIGNVLSIMVMRTRRMRNSNAAMFVISISILDIIFLVLRNFWLLMIKTEIYRMDTTCISKEIMHFLTDVSAFIKCLLISLLMKF